LIRLSQRLVHKSGAGHGRIGHQSSQDESVDYWLPLTDEDKPPPIKDSGVSVVLLGKSKDDDTMAPPAGADLPSQWVAAYLERRYFDIPNGITLKVLRPVEIYDSGRGAHRAIYDTIRGQRYYLDKHSDYQGRMPLPEMNAHVWWWVLSEGITSGGKTWNNRGHVAALFQDELHESRSGASRISALKDFGIYSGHNRVVIYIEPTNVLGANTTRTALILAGGVPVDYAGIGAAFAERMPDELAAYMASQVSSEHGDHRKSILKNLKEVEEALRQARFRRSNRGNLEQVLPEPGGKPSFDDVSEGGRASQGSPRHQDVVGRLGSEYLRRAREELDRRRAKEIAADPIPKIVWDDSGTAVAAGRAATYTHTSHVVTANTTFDFYRDMLEWSMQEAKSRMATEVDEDTLRGICEDEVRRWFEESLAQAVVVLRPMSHDARWGPRVFDTGLTCPRFMYQSL
jgi:hypothetical protein